jgi:hypothetical protein
MNFVVNSFGLLFHLSKKKKRIMQDQLRSDNSDYSPTRIDLPGCAVWHGALRLSRGDAMNFDVDAHVEESVETWKYLDEKFARRRPVPITLEDQPALLGQNSFWLIDGAVVPRTSGKGLSLFGTPTTMARMKTEDALTCLQAEEEVSLATESTISMTDFGWRVALRGICSSTWLGLWPCHLRPLDKENRVFPPPMGRLNE